MKRKTERTLPKANYLKTSLDVGRAKRRTAFSLKVQALETRAQLLQERGGA